MRAHLFNHSGGSDHTQMCPSQPKLLANIYSYSALIQLRCFAYRLNMRSELQESRDREQRFDMSYKWMQGGKMTSEGNLSEQIYESYINIPEIFLGFYEFDLSYWSFSSCRPETSLFTADFRLKHLSCALTFEFFF